MSGQSSALQSPDDFSVNISINNMLLISLTFNGVLLSLNATYHSKHFFFHLKHQNKHRMKQLFLSLTLCCLFGALWLGQVGASLLFGVTPTDPLTFIVVSLLLIAVAVAACCFPARRAMKIEPIVALRQQ